MKDDPETALRVAKSRIANALFGGACCIDPQLGELTLRPHQLTAVARLREIIRAYGGALLADAVGLGKTYVALAVAREYRSVMVVCPAALRDMWERAMKAAGVAIAIVSVESLSRGRLPDERSDLLIVDEAHHLRTPGTRRYDAVAQLARRARVLLLSATPLHNSRRDLTSVVALFAGAGVSDWGDRALARLIVRRDDTTAEQTLPAISGAHVLSPGGDDDCLDAILALPSAVPAADEGVAHALTTISLVHLWTSSRAALLASVRKRLARATALHDAVAAGHLPTASELAAWAYADGALQLAFPLFTPGSHIIDQQSLHQQLGEFVDRAEILIRRCQATPDPDVARVQLLRTLRERHKGHRIVAFAQYAHTVTALGQLMRSDPGIAIVTANSARIASGPLAREDVLQSFRAEAPPVRPVEHIDLLLTTDLLSEGIDLRGASVIVHLDLPWNPARMEQRVGRSRRIGSRFETIHVYTFAPPTAAERVIELRRRLMEKVNTARAVVGGSFDPFGPTEAGESSVGAGEMLRQRIRGWLVDEDCGNPHAPVVAATCGPLVGWIAAVVVGGVARMIGDFGSGITDNALELIRTIRHIGIPAPVSASRSEHAVAAIREWLLARDATAAMERQSIAKRAVLDRLTQTVARAPRHRRSAMMTIAQRARRALESAAGIGTERVLATLAQSSADDDAWVQSIDALGDLHVDESPSDPSSSRMVAVILLEPISAGDATPG